MPPLGINPSATGGTNNFIAYHHPVRTAKYPSQITFLNGSPRFKKSRVKKPLELRKVLPKNALMMLHELRPSAEYRLISKTGLTHKPIFTVGIKIEEHSFEGVGKTKKEARVNVAEKCVEFLLKHPEYVQKCANPNKNKPNVSSETATSAEAESSTNLDHPMSDNDESNDCKEKEEN
jgi:hypothetical protein